MSKFLANITSDYTYDILKTECIGIIRERYIRKWSETMKNILIGLILIFLDFNFTFGNLQIDIIPDFVGYIVIVNGLVEMAEESPQFMEVKPYARGMAFYSGLLFCIDLFGISKSFGALSYVLGIVSVIISLYIVYKIVMGVIDMEEKYSVNLYGNSLKSKWTALVVFDSLSYLALLFSPLVIIALIAGVIILISLLVTFNNSQKVYYSTVASAKGID